MEKYFIEKEAINSNDFIENKLKSLMTYIFMCEVEGNTIDKIKDILTYELVSYTNSIKNSVDCYSYITGFLDYISDIRDCGIIKFVKKYKSDINTFIKKCNVTDVVCSMAINNDNKIKIIDICNLYLYNLSIVLHKYFDDIYIYDLFYDLKSDLEVTLYENICDDCVSCIDLLDKIRINNYTILEETIERDFFSNNIRNLLGMLDAYELRIFMYCVISEIVGYNYNNLNNITVSKVSNILELGYIKSYLELKSLRKNVDNLSDNANGKFNIKRKVKSI